MLRNRYNQVPYLTKDTTRENENTQKHHIQECQEVSPFQAGDHKAAINRQDSMTNTRIIKKGSIKEALPWSGQ